MQHFCAKVRELRRLAIRNFRNRARFRHQPRVRGQHAVHIGPDNDFICVERCAQNSRRKIRAAPAERRQLSIYGRTNETGHHRHNPFFKQWEQPRLRFLPCQIHLRLSAAVKRIGDNKFRCVDRFACRARFFDRCRHQRRGKPFS